MAALPTGTVMILFADIEGSIRLWEEYPDAMQDGRARPMLCCDGWRSSQGSIS
jgi:hypothetical protein